MTYEEFLTRVVDEGIEAARESYGRGTDRSDQKMKGSIAGFEACRDKSPSELVAILAEATKRREEARRAEADDYWYHRCFEAEIEWTCNCVSALLQMLHRPVIHSVTYRGLRKTLEIVDPEALARFDAEREKEANPQAHAFERR